MLSATGKTMEMCAEHTSVLQLNDDCLQQIFRKLNLREQLIVANVCQRFRDVIVEYIFKAEFRILRTIDEKTHILSNMEYHELFELVAPYIEEFTINVIKNSACSSFIGRYQFRPELIYYFRHKLPKLRTLACFDESFNDEHIQLLTKNCANLEELQIVTELVTGVNLHEFRQLHTFKAEKCTLDEVNLSALLPQLSCLKIRDCYLDPARLIVKENNTTLQRLSVSMKFLNDGFAHALKQFKALQLLSVKYIMDDDNLIPETTTKSFGEYLRERISEMKFMSNLNAVNILLKGLAVYLPALETILAYLQHIEGTTKQFVHVRWLPKPTIHLHIFDTAQLPQLEFLLSSCSFVSHIYLENCVINSNDFKVFIFKAIQLMQQNSEERETLTMHLVVKNVYKLAYTKLLNDIIESDEYRKQNSLQLKFDSPSKENKLTLPEYFNNIDFGFV